MEIHTTIVQTGGKTTGVLVPDAVVEQLGAGKKPPVRVTINGHTYRSSIASMGGRFLISLSAENRELARVSGGDEVDVSIELDDQPRAVDVPKDFAAALNAEPAAKAAFDALSYSNKRRHVLSIDGAKTAETRQRRIDKAITELLA